MIADDNDDGVVREAVCADRLEQPLELTIGFVQDVEIAPEIPVVRARFAQQVEQRHTRRRLIGMMRLVGPSHQKERALRVLIQPLEHRVHHAAVLDAPRRQRRRARKAGRVAQVREAAPLEERFPSRPSQIARHHERGAIAAIAEHRRQRRAAGMRKLIGEVAEVELGIGREEHRGERVRASADVRVEIVEDQAARRLGFEIRRRVVKTAAQPGPSRRHRLEHDDDHIERSLDGFR